MKGAVPMDFVGKNEYNKEKIAYQNKDIASKVLAENFKGKTFRVYGLDLPDIRQVLPTNIPVIKANELRLDNLFALADDSVALVDYESEYRTLSCGRDHRRIYRCTKRPGIPDYLRKPDIQTYMGPDVHCDPLHHCHAAVFCTLSY